MTFSDPAILTVNVLTPNQDYFYWPCISGENFPPAFTGSGVAYGSKGQYPAVSYSGNVGAVGGTATWPIIPSWKYTKSSFNGLTVTFKVNVGASAFGNGVQIWFNSSDEMLFQRDADFQGSIGSSFAAGNTTQPQTWYPVTLEVGPDGTGTITIGNVSSAVTTHLNSLPLQMKAATVAAGTAGTTVQYNVSQLQVTYS